MQGNIFVGAPTGSQARRAGRVVPTVAAHPRVFFDRAQRPPGARGSQGKVVPTVATPGSPPDHAVIPVCYPDHPRSSIPATYPHLE